MTTKIFIVAVALTALITYAQKKGWINLRNKERPTMGNVLGSFEEIFSPAKHQAQVELKEQKERKVQISSSDDNHIHIDLSNK